ncbi:PTS sugar transporter subunit IIA [Streptomyces sp. NPDC017056]|uniref:PTS sugar transporter subunit IIA n=1 Tax=Streptomyces sp. NPDC017056 TaxID=3364973 RepID=UPI0037B591F2
MWRRCAPPESSARRAAGPPRPNPRRPTRELPARAFASAVRRRMSGGATGFHGIALLTARSRSVSAPAAAFARVPARLGRRGADGRPVSDVFVLAVPKRLRDPRPAQVFSLLARHSAHPGFRRLLRAAHTTDDLYELFRLVR